MGKVFPGHYHIIVTRGLLSSHVCAGSLSGRMAKDASRYTGTALSVRS